MPNMSLVRRLNHRPLDARDGGLGFLETNDLGISSKAIRLIMSRNFFQNSTITHAALIKQ